MAGTETATQKSCRVKTAGIGRYIKEYLSYKKEVQQDLAKVDKMISEGKDIYSINKMVKIQKIDCLERGS